MRIQTTLLLFLFALLPPGMAFARDCSSPCKTDGRCHEDKDKINCIALTDQDCLQSDWCKEHGNCHVVERECRPASEEDCKNAPRCKMHGVCLYNNGHAPYCIKNVRIATANHSEQNCLSMGGKWLTEKGRGRITGCIIATTDKGKACNDSRECESVCVDYQCYEWSDFRGCGLIENGKEMCID